MERSGCRADWLAWVEPAKPSRAGPSEESRARPSFTEPRLAESTHRAEPLQHLTPRGGGKIGASSPPSSPPGGRARKGQPVLAGGELL